MLVKEKRERLDLIAAYAQAPTNVPVQRYVINVQPFVTRMGRQLDVIVRDADGLLRDVTRPQVVS